LSENIDDIELLKRRKLIELQRRIAEEKRRREEEERKQNILRVILTPEARSRLTNIKMVKPEFANQLELQLISLAQQGKLPIPLTDEQLKSILMELQEKKRDIKITWM